MEIDLDHAFEAISKAMQQSKIDRSTVAACSEAERQGMLEQGNGTPSKKNEWVLSSQKKTLWFQCRWYDQSHPFSIQPDMNILSLELRDGGGVIRRTEERFED